MKVWRLHNKAHQNIRQASTHWRHVDSPPPIPRQIFDNSAPPNAPVMTIDVNQNYQKFIVNEYTTNAFEAKTNPGTVLKFDGELYELLKNPVADETFQLMYQVKDCGFLQFREHFRPLLRNRNDSTHTRFLITGDRQCGKTLTCYALLLTFMKTKFPGVIIPALQLSHWFQDTTTSPLIYTPQGLLDFPEFNAEFLRFLVACNTYSESPNKDVLNNCVLKEDERWTSNMYSFKGESLLSAAKIGISTPPVASHVIQVLLSTILEDNIPSVVIADNANLLSEIHSSRLQNLRDLKSKEWWDQPRLYPENITLLRNLKEFITLHEKGKVYLTIDQRRNIGDQLVQETGNVPHRNVDIPNTPSPTEFLKFLNLMRKEEFISRDLNSEQVTELSYLTGRNYVDTFKYMFII
ncbi:hypothetical protein ACHWQZ_G003203 [Mnemiopsis leidyi]